MLLVTFEIAAQSSLVSKGKPKMSYVVSVLAVVSIRVRDGITRNLAKGLKFLAAAEINYNHNVVRCLNSAWLQSLFYKTAIDYCSKYRLGNLAGTPARVLCGCKAHITDDEVIEVRQRGMAMRREGMPEVDEIVKVKDLQGRRIGPRLPNMLYQLNWSEHTTSGQEGQFLGRY